MSEIKEEVNKELLEVLTRLYEMNYISVNQEVKMRNNCLKIEVNSIDHEDIDYLKEACNETGANWKIEQIRDEMYIKIR